MSYALYSLYEVSYCYRYVLYCLLMICSPQIMQEIQKTYGRKPNYTVIVLEDNLETTTRFSEEVVREVGVLVVLLIHNNLSNII